MSSLPKYAQGADPTRLVQLFCKGQCRQSRWHLLDKPHPGVAVLKKAEMGEYCAKCLMCGEVALDNYNWYG